MAKINYRTPKEAIPAKAPYLTKRILGRAIGKVTKHTEADALRLRGYVLRSEDGWIIKVDQNGNKTPVSRLDTIKIPGKIVLD